MTVTGYVEELNLTATSLPITILQESNETITVLFDTDEIGAGEYKFTFTIDAGTTPLVNNPEPVDLNQVKFTADNQAERPNVVPIIIVLIFAFGIILSLEAEGLEADQDFNVMTFSMFSLGYLIV